MRNEAEAARREREIGLEQPLELEERLVVEHDVVELAQPAAGLGQTIGDRARRESAASCFLRVKRSSCAAATMRPSTTRAAALS